MNISFNTSNAPKPVKKPRGFFIRAFSIVGWIGGWMLARNISITILIWPLLFTGVTWWLAARLLPEHKRFVVPAFAVQCGEALWILLGVVLLRSFNGYMPDLVLLTSGLTWLITKPSRGPLYLLGAYQVVALAYCAYLLQTGSGASPYQQGLIVHIVWQSLSLLFITLAFVNLRNEPLHSSSTTP